MHIALNAHLLSGRAGYRSAGIHSYIAGLLRTLPRVLPNDWRLTAFVGGANTLTFPGVTMRRAALDTESPARRIVWEQLIQPFALAGCDLHHALAFVAPALTRVPAVATIYDLSFVHYPDRLSAPRRLYLDWFTRLTCQRARRLIAISHSTARDLTATFGVPADRIDIALPGYDREAFHPLPAEQIAVFRAEKGLPDRFWLFIGTLEPRKNLLTLIEAYAALPARDRLPLILAGGKGWDYQPIFDAAARHRLQNSIRFPGFIPTTEVALWYNSAEAFVYPSIFEGFGLPVLEAMACGTPVITSDTSSLPEVIGAAGALVAPRDVGAWTDALRQASADESWRTTARTRGLERASLFSWEETARATAASYRKALGLSR
ncbi:MAG: glycosyltransferase family 1 protein [Chloroflexota bacterium]|nr:glycosyltransferase family 1 protein [Chloroflexota bacterium]